MKLYFTALLLLASCSVKASHTLMTQSLYRERRPKKNIFLGRSFNTYETILEQEPTDQSDLEAYAEQIRKEQKKINPSIQERRKQQATLLEEEKAQVRNEIEAAKSNTTQQRIIEKNGEILRAFLRNNEEILPFFKERDVVINEKPRTEVFMHIQPRSSQENHILYNNQKYKIHNPQYELCGLLGGVLSSLVKLNKETIGCHYVCRCTSSSSSVILKPESGARDIKALVVPTDRLFDVTVDTIEEKHYLCVYEHPDYKPPVKDGDNDDRWVFIQ